MTNEDEKADGFRLPPLTDAFPDWLSGEQRRRIFLVCRGFSLLHRAIRVRKNIFMHQCLLREERKDHEKKTPKELEFRENLGALLDEQVPIPVFSRLKLERKRLANKFFWGQRDIAIIMGKDQSNISRLLRRMEQDERWKAKLQSFSVSVGQKKGYRDGIFSLILDYCEAEYLERFSQPRRGGPMPESRVEELLEAWQKMRRHVELEASEE